MERIPVKPMSFRGLCKLCWHPAAKEDRTAQGYHIECAKEAAAIIADLLHAKRGLVYEQWYSSRYPGRPVPGVHIGRPPSSVKE